MKNLNSIRDRFSLVKEASLANRYLPPEALTNLIEKHSEWIKVEVLGSSVLGNEVYGLEVGKGEKVILAWSQMHGNESTTTRACFDLLAYLQKFREEEAVDRFLNEYTFYLIPQLNPDGSKQYTRENANQIDLNRDAQDLSQPESKILRSLFDRLGPVICLNLHGQRSIYGMSNGQPSIVSFLAPSADMEKTITSNREVAMEAIGEMASLLNTLEPGCIGLYDDGFNPDCVGDSFQSLGVPTILFEAGHYPGDYQREGSRELIFLAFARLFGLIDVDQQAIKPLEYKDIPKHSQNFRDVILRQVTIGDRKCVDLAIQFEEQLSENAVSWEMVVDKIGDLSNLFGHQELNMEGGQILTNSHENVFEGDKITTLHQNVSIKMPIFL